MAVFENLKIDSPIVSVEFSPVSDGNFSFFYIDSPISKEGVKKWLTSKDIGQEIIAETLVGSHPVFVTHGDKTQTGILKALQGRGERMQPYERKKDFSEHAWQTGAVMAFVGQCMQLTSSFLRPDRKADWSLRMLAVPNLLATTWIFFYGAQRSEDKNRLTFLKQHFNEELGTHVPGGMASLPNIHENRVELHGEHKEKETFKEKIDSFLKRNSVTVGEIGLRYMGATSLALSKNKWTSRAGMASLTGKTVSLTAKAEDPYNPKPHTWLDTLREKFTFRAGGWIETAAFATLAVDGWNKKKISFTKGGPVHRDYISAIGGALFTIRYVIRHWAPFGIRDMNMKELYAHVTDSLAQMPPEQLPQLIADTAADITNHFKDKHLKYGEVFNQLLTDLYRYHHIALDNLGTEPEERTAKVNGNGNGHEKPHSYVQAVQETSVKAKQTLSHKNRADIINRTEQPESSLAR